MSNSPLIDGTLLSPNNSGTRTKPITKITPHRAAGVLNAKNLAGCFMGNREASTNYCIGNEGGLFLSLDEGKRAWTSFSAANDQQEVAIEVSNSKTGGDWPVGGKAYVKLVDLRVDICKRNPGIKQKNGKPGLYSEGKIELDSINETTASYFGLMKHCNSYSLRSQLCKDFVLVRKSKE